MRKYLTVLFSMSFLALGSCAQRSEAPVQPIDLQAEKAAVETVIGQLFESWETKDIELFSSVMVHDPDMVCFGTDAAERWVGWQVLHDSVEKQLQAYDSIQISVVEQDTKVNGTGSAAWFAVVMDWTIATAEEPVELAGMRMTGVLDKRDGNWVVVQMHVSVPVAGQAVEY